MRFKNEIVKALSAALLATSSVMALADNDSRVLKIEGVPETGFNRLFGEPLWDFGSPLGTAGFDTLFAFNPNGDQPLPLSHDSPGSTLVATGVDPAFLQLFGLTEADFDQADVNLPLRQVRVNVDFAGEVRQTLRGHLEAGQLEPSLAEPSDPITLEQWMKARGEGIIKCDKEGNATISLKMRGLVPSGLYTAAAAFETFNPDAFQDVRPAVPIGGVPNAFMTDEKGNATYERVLNFCPMDLKVGEAPFLAITIIYHPDQNLYGTVPILFKKGILPGLQGIGHIGFLVTGENVQ